MDPTANLEEQREIYKRILNGESDEDDALRLAELVEALDEWMMRGGFLPLHWKSRRDFLRGRRPQ